MTIEQTVEIPADHRLTLDLPNEIPAGTAKIELAIHPVADAFRSGLAASYLASNSPRSTEEALAEAERKAADPHRKPFSACFGSLKDSATFAGYPVAIQRAMREEWDDPWDPAVQESCRAVMREAREAADTATHE